MSRNLARRLRRRHGIGIKPKTRGKDNWRTPGRLKSASQKDTTRHAKA